MRIPSELLKRPKPKVTAFEKLVFGFICLAAVAGVGVVAVLIWAIIRIVLHFT